MKYKTILQLAITILLLLPFENVEAGSKAPGKKTRNIIFIIGDGMGVAHLYAGMSASPDRFWLEMFPYAGLVKTYSADNYITDSAAMRSR